jgi:uncharacterized protein (TIGR02996 family)
MICPSCKGTGVVAGGLLALPRAREFIREATARLDDPAPRLVFADWLEEHGDDTGRPALLRAPGLWMYQDGQIAWAGNAGPLVMFFGPYAAPGRCGRCSRWATFHARGAWLCQTHFVTRGVEEAACDP